MSRRFSVLNRLLLLSLAAFAACVFTIILAARAEFSSRAQVRVAFEKIQVLNTLLVSALDAETGQRGYFLTADEAYLAPYETGRRSVVEQQAALRELTGDDLTPAQSAELEELDAALEAKMAELEATTRLYRSGNALQAVGMIRTDAGKIAMDRVRASAGQLVAEEHVMMDRGRSAAQQARILVLLSVTLLALLSLAGFALALRNLRRAQKLGLVEQQARELTEERERADLLARELNHRVKNLFAIVQSIISSTARQETDARVAAKKIRDRIFALSRAHSLTSSLDMQQQTTLAALVDAIVHAQVSEHCTLNASGPDVTVLAQHVTPLGMILHELTTNAVKYGAGSCDHGRIDVTWTVNPAAAGAELEIDWQETCTEDVDLSSPGPDGFGSRMMAISLTQLRGESRRVWTAKGLRMEIVLPMPDHSAVSDRNKEGV